MAGTGPIAHALGAESIDQVTNATARTFRAFAEQTKSDLKALQLWGVWRNGEPVEMDYSARISVLPEKYHPFPSARHLMGVELVSVFLPYRGDTAPKTSTLTAMLPQLFTYRPPETPVK